MSLYYWRALLLMAACHLLNGVTAYYMEDENVLSYIPLPLKKPNFRFLPNKAMVFTIREPFYNGKQGPIAKTAPKFGISFLNRALNQYMEIYVTTSEVIVMQRNGATTPVKTAVAIESNTLGGGVAKNQNGDLIPTTERFTHAQMTRAAVVYDVRLQNNGTHLDFIFNYGDEETVATVPVPNYVADFVFYGDVYLHNIFETTITDRWSSTDGIERLNLGVLKSKEILIMSGIYDCRKIDLDLHFNYKNQTIFSLRFKANTIRFADDDGFEDELPKIAKCVRPLKFINFEMSMRLEFEKEGPNGLFRYRLCRMYECYESHIRKRDLAIAQFDSIVSDPKSYFALRYLAKLP